MPVMSLARKLHNCGSEQELARSCIIVVSRKKYGLALHSYPLQHSFKRRVLIKPVTLPAVCTSEICLDVLI